jgi:hypothetical protein
MYPNLPHATNDLMLGMRVEEMEDTDLCAGMRNAVSSVPELMHGRRPAWVDAAVAPSSLFPQGIRINTLCCDFDSLAASSSNSWSSHQVSCSHDTAESQPWRPAPLTILLIYSQIYSPIFEMGYFAACTMPGLMTTHSARPVVHLSAYPGSVG